LLLFFFYAVGEFPWTTGYLRAGEVVAAPCGLFGDWTRATLTSSWYWAILWFPSISCIDFNDLGHTKSGSGRRAVSIRDGVRQLQKSRGLPDIPAWPVWAVHLARWRTAASRHNCSSNHRSGFYLRCENPNVEGVTYRALVIQMVTCSP